MPLPANHTIKAGHYIIDATGQRVWCCNCPGTPVERTLRFIAANRGLYSLPASQSADKTKGVT